MQMRFLYMYFSVAVIVLAMAGCASAPAPVKAAPETRSVSEVSEDIKARLAKDERLKGSNIVIRFDGRTVIMSGTVANKDQFGWAPTVAAGTPGVKGVINRLQLEGAVSPEIPTSATPTE